MSIFKRKTVLLAGAVAFLTGCSLITGDYHADRDGAVDTDTDADTDTDTDTDTDSDTDEIEHPIPGDGDATLTITDILPAQATVSWNAASDNHDSATDLEYRLYTSLLADIDTVDNVNLNGSPAGDWTSAVTTLDASGLTPNAVQYINVLVRDLAGNEAVYIMESVTTPNPIFMFHTPASAGFVLDRDAGNSACETAKSNSFVTLPSANVKILISFEDDSIVDMPDDYWVPIDRFMTGPTGDVISIDWANMFDENIDQSLNAAGIVTSLNWWSGSNSAGEIDAPNCSNWTPTGMETGIVGNTGATESEWIESGTQSCLTSTAQFVCLAWD